jgi:hypothetical protein
VRAAAEDGRGLGGLDGNVLGLTRTDERAHLEEAEVGGLGGAAHAHGKLDFHGTAQCVGAEFLDVIEKLRQRENVVLEDGRKGDDARTGTAEAVADGVVVARIGGGDIVQRAVGLGIAKGKGCARADARSDVVRHGFGGLWLTVGGREVKGHELGLRVAQDIFNAGELDHVARITRTEGERLATVHHGATKAESDGGNAVVGLHGLGGIEVPRTHDAGEVRIKRGP